MCSKNNRKINMLKRLTAVMTVAVFVFTTGFLPVDAFAVTGDNGEIGEATNLAQLCSVELVRSGKARIPKDKRLAEVPVPDRKAPSLPPTDDIDCPF